MNGDTVNHKALQYIQWQLGLYGDNLLHSGNWFIVRFEEVVNESHHILIVKCSVGKHSPHFSRLAPHLLSSAFDHRRHRLGDRVPIEGPVIIFLCFDGDAFLDKQARVETLIEDRWQDYKHIPVSKRLNDRSPSKVKERSPNRMMGQDFQLWHPP